MCEIISEAEKHLLSYVSLMRNCGYVTTASLASSAVLVHKACMYAHACVCVSDLGSAAPSYSSPSGFQSLPAVYSCPLSTRPFIRSSARVQGVIFGFLPFFHLGTSKREDVGCCCVISVWVCVVFAVFHSSRPRPRLLSSSSFMSFQCPTCHRSLDMWSFSLLAAPPVCVSVCSSLIGCLSPCSHGSI